MAEPAIQVIPSKPAPSAPGSAPLPSRPKALRRPSNLARASLHAEVLTADFATSEAPLAEPASPAHTRPAPAWQEDRRFTLLLLATVLLANIGFSLWLGGAAASRSPASADAQHPLAVKPILAPRVDE